MPSHDTPPQEIASPCIKECTVGIEGKCIGCHRTLDEIARWASASNSAKLQIVDRCNQRKREQQEQSNETESE